MYLATLAPTIDTGRKQKFKIKNCERYDVQIEAKLLSTSVSIIVASYQVAKKSREEKKKNFLKKKKSVWLTNKQDKYWTLFNTLEKKHKFQYE